MIKERNIAVSILLSIVTCGIYSIIWFISLTDEVSAASEDSSLPSGAMAFLLTLVTCGIYGYYWAYKMGKATLAANEKRGITASDNSILYIILAVFGLQIVNYALIQNELNAMANSGK